MSPGLGQSDPDLHDSGQNTRHRGPQPSENQEARGSADDLQDLRPGMSLRTRGSDSPANKSASREHAQ